METKINIIPRPLELPKAELTEVLRKFVDQILKTNSVTRYTTKEEIVAELMQLDQYTLSDDGYEIAKELEDVHSGCLNFNAQLVEELDCVSNFLDDKLRENTKNWVKNNNIIPTYKIGDKFEFVNEPNYIINLKEKVFYITSINTELGYYLIDADRNMKGGLVTVFEKLEDVVKEGIISSKFE